MSILNDKTEKKALEVLAKTLPHFSDLAPYFMSDEDAGKVREAETAIRAIIESNGFQPVLTGAKGFKLIKQQAMPA